MSYVIIAKQLSGVDILIGPDYEKWDRYSEVMLGLLDLDIFLLEPKPDTPAADSSVSNILKFVK